MSACVKIMHYAGVAPCLVGPQNLTWEQTNQEQPEVIPTWVEKAMCDMEELRNLEEVKMAEE